MLIYSIVNNPDPFSFVLYLSRDARKPAAGRINYDDKSSDLVLTSLDSLLSTTRFCVKNN